MMAPAGGRVSTSTQEKAGQAYKTSPDQPGI